MDYLWHFPKLKAKVFCLIHRCSSHAQARISPCSGSMVVLPISQYRRCTLNAMYIECKG
jgi:hypothetical protein